MSLIFEDIGGAAADNVVRILAETTTDSYDNSTSHGDSHGDEEGGHHGAGVHIEYNDLYFGILFLTCIFLSGKIAGHLLKMPSLVGEIVCGLLLGPPLADFVPNAEAWVLLGEIGLVLLVLEAGIDINVSTLELIGTRGFLIALVGSILPIGLGMVIAVIIYGSSDIKAIIALGATFGPTSLGIALNILRSGGVLNTPVGQLIISAAVIDDMIALIILSQLQALVGQVTVIGIVMPIVSACLFLFVGGYIAIFWAPKFMDRFVLPRIGDPANKGKVELTVMIGILLAMMPATYYAKASYLMGAFVAGLGFSSSHELHVSFVRQFKRLMQWLMRIFFAASIGFQVPIRDFGKGHVIWQGLVFTLALLGKIAVGFMVPKFTQGRAFTGLHLRDCLITSFSMAAEGEFAFVIASFSIDQGIVTRDQYASVVLAVLLSTILPPFALRFTISYWNKRSEQQVQEIAKEEMERHHNLELSDSQRQANLVDDIKNQTVVFLCIQTQSLSRWGLLNRMVSEMARMGLDIIDHRSWHPRGIDTTLVTEAYVKDIIEVQAGKSQEVLDTRIAYIEKVLSDIINQEDAARVKVQRWFPGVLKEIVEDVDEKSKVTEQKKINVESRLLREACVQLDQKQALQTTATKEKTVEEILAGMTEATLPNIEEGKTASTDTTQTRTKRRRQKMRSTPVVGGSLFDEVEEKKEDAAMSKAKSDKKLPVFSIPARGHKAEIIVDGESYNIRINDQALKSLRTGFMGDFLHSGAFAVEGAMIQPDTADVAQQLQGFIRNAPSLSKIVEEPAEGGSETSSMHNGTLPTEENGEG